MANIIPVKIYEVKLDIEKYVYFLRINKDTFGLFDVVSESKVEIKTLENRKIIDIKSCSFSDWENYKKLNMRQSGWRKIGEMDLSTVKIPDMAVYNSWNPEESHRDCLVIKDFKEAIKVTPEEYKKLVERGLILGRVPSSEVFKKYITRNIENIINNQPMDSSWDTSRFHD